MDAGKNILRKLIPFLSFLPHRKIKKLDVYCLVFVFAQGNAHVLIFPNLI
jgi:hypothetical protein